MAHDGSEGDEAAHDERGDARGDLGSDGHVIEANGTSCRALGLRSPAALTAPGLLVGRVGLEPTIVGL